jgi:hypothetical protein
VKSVHPELVEGWVHSVRTSTGSVNACGIYALGTNEVRDRLNC